MKPLFVLFIQSAIERIRRVYKMHLALVYNSFALDVDMDTHIAIASPYTNLTSEESN